MYREGVNWTSKKKGKRIFNDSFDKLTPKTVPSMKMWLDYEKKYICSRDFTKP